MTYNVKFLVQGSSEEAYEVTFSGLASNNMSVFCTCQAGKHRLICKHKINILRGSAENVLSNNADEIKTLQEWLKGTALEREIAEMDRLEIEYEKAKNAFSRSKKSVAKSMILESKEINGHY